MSSRIVAGIVILVCIGLAIFLWARKSNDNKDSQQVQDSGPILSVQAFNQSTNTDANAGVAKPGDVLAFTLSAENHSNNTMPGYVVKVNIADLVNSATLIDSGGASYNSADHTLEWTPLDIEPGQAIQQRFTARVNPVAANAPAGIIRISFNNNVQISVTGKIAGAATAQPTPGTYRAPKSGSGLNLVILLAGICTIAWVLRKKLGITAR